MAATATLKLQNIPFSKLVPNAENQRQVYGNLAPLIYTVVNDIKSLEPLRVFPAQNGVYTIDRGHRRYRAIHDAIEKGLLERNISIPCVVDSDLNQEKSLLGQISSNDTKKYTPLEQFEVIGLLLNLGYTLDSICTKLSNLSRKHVTYNVNLHQFHDVWLKQAATDYDVMSLSCGFKLASLDDLRGAESPIWPLLKEKLVGLYEVRCKKIPEKEIFDILASLRNNIDVDPEAEELEKQKAEKEAEEKAAQPLEVPSEIMEKLIAARENGVIDKKTLKFLVFAANIQFEV
jgi:hypothetical protein